MQRCDAEFTVLATGLRFPEGPVVLPGGDVLVMEIAGGTVVRVGAGGRRVVATPGGGPNGAAIGPDGACYVCNSGGFEWIEDEAGIRPHFLGEEDRSGWIERVDLDSGATEVICSSVDGRPLRAPNDIVFDAHGGFWFTDLGRPRARSLDRGAVLYATTDGRVREVVFPMITPNGVGLSPDGATLYVAETETARLWSFEVVEPGVVRPPAAGAPIHGGTIVVTVPGYQRFDSLAVEAGGNICVATPHTGCVTVVSPDGELLEQVMFPDVTTTNICFGGPDLRTAYVTLSRSGRLVSLPWPRPGLRLAFG